jgi:hypothetical protein
MASRSTVRLDRVVVNIWFSQLVRAAGWYYVPVFTIGCRAVPAEGLASPGWQPVGSPKASVLQV